MNLADQYIRQGTWRRWDEMISHVPLLKNDVVLDIGCGPGIVTKFLADRVHHVIGIDANEELINVARNEAPKNISYVVRDARALGQIEHSPVEGIWSSFTAAYFPNFEPVLRHWLSYLKPGGWLALVEVSQLFTGHDPIPDKIRTSLKEYGDSMRKSASYDVDMGDRLEETCRACGIKIQERFLVDDGELAFQGPASSDVIDAWKLRFDRLASMKKYFGEHLYENVKEVFINSLTSVEHTTVSKVVMIVGRKSNE